MKFLLKLDEIDSLVEELKTILKKYKNNCIVILRGDLASGKTTFVKKFVNSLGIDELVTSPTFSVQSIYSNTIFHYDIYNKSLKEFISLGLLEEFDKDGIHFVEWGDEKMEELLKSYGFNVIVLKIEKKDDKRLYLLNE
ncbi:tRNA (adenosine(37)-N6)-threonylcarbamoyltransferase complex ATPase subunit type 1 TsaE [Halarcobacter anaerophilus]|uniref:tRNA threonylcarbamoyladenosine biosynthesis protein TsaE n=1 Tax=Halarcobacter anaerophilus TaxID=877500 RepID=A0A4Q0Y267_9BACT|nr:tRNA (adenosine(37)-N6)-threonylcarbamoyltransferase complex ATPase subunit type 1 TsaE [Halarcobacter anaerophilus]QDF28916.1 N6-L-threonylcarbamoyladenine synthase, TsaE subunit [Halarcobacter anaerophilus]RXJ63555.1 tRNA (adenosine(37)-N6)-threonylcarbamoyltransferase complex ATPase subunit type 1 TsaE [Halarcobacter anaerophilus]